MFFPVHFAVLHWAHICRDVWAFLPCRDHKLLICGLNLAFRSVLLCLNRFQGWINYYFFFLIGEIKLNLGFRPHLQIWVEQLLLCLEQAHLLRMPQSPPRLTHLQSWAIWHVSSWSQTVSFTRGTYLVADVKWAVCGTERPPTVTRWRSLPGCPWHLPSSGSWYSLNNLFYFNLLY